MLGRVLSLAAEVLNTFTVSVRRLPLRSWMSLLNKTVMTLEADKVVVRVTVRLSPE